MVCRSTPDGSATSFPVAYAVAPIFSAPYDRIAQIIGVLTDLPITTAADIGPQMSKLSARLLA